MTAASELNEVARVADGLKNIGLEPVLVGGMALVLMGSRRITRDYDFVIPHPGNRLNALVDLFYERGFELASKVNADGDIVATIDNPRVASIRLKLDGPASVFFWHPSKRLRIDLLFDFPVAAAGSPLEEVALRQERRELEVDVGVVERTTGTAREAVHRAQEPGELEERGSADRGEGDPLLVRRVVAVRSRHRGSRRQAPRFVSAVTGSKS
jgi:hypothetical protein